MKKICFLGLSHSGKTCYLYSVCHLLSRGVSVNNHMLSVNSTRHLQTLQLQRGIEMMAEGEWPQGSTATLTYVFDFKIDGRSVENFTIYDYRGGILTGTTDSEMNDFNDLLDTFNQSDCIVIFVDGETLLQSLDSRDLSPIHQNNVSQLSRLKAHNKINYIESLLYECKGRMSTDVPVLLAITKSDLFSEDELISATELLKRLLPSVFATDNDRIVGISAVSLGKNLQDIDGRLTGYLYLNTEGNIHIPLLFALLQNAENDALTGNLFTPDKIRFFLNGQEVFMVGL